MVIVSPTGRSHLIISNIYPRTFFPDANITVRLDFGEFILHPGKLVHGGVDITRGNRFLMIFFCHTEQPAD